MKTSVKVIAWIVFAMNMFSASVPWWTRLLTGTKMEPDYDAAIQSAGALIALAIIYYGGHHERDR